MNNKQKNSIAISLGMTFILLMFILSVIMGQDELCDDKFWNDYQSKYPYESFNPC